MADKKRILVADDDQDILDFVSMQLKRSGYEPLCADNGKDALALAVAQAPALALLDVMMPFVDGYQVAYQITSRRSGGFPKVAIMTARNADLEKESLSQCGADGMIQKPFGADQLTAFVSKIIGPPSVEAP